MEGDLQQQTEENIREERHLARVIRQLALADSPDECFKLAQPDIEQRRVGRYISDLVQAHGISKSAVIDAAGLSHSYGYDLMRGRCVRPGRDRLIMLSLGLNASLRETQHLLRLSGNTELWPRNTRDLAIIYCLQRGMSREACDDVLFSLGEHTLLVAC